LHDPMYTLSLATVGVCASQPPASNCQRISGVAVLSAWRAATPTASSTSVETESGRSSRRKTMFTVLSVKNPVASRSGGEWARQYHNASVSLAVRCYTMTTREGRAMDRKEHWDHVYRWLAHRPTAGNLLPPADYTCSTKLRTPRRVAPGRTTVFRAPECLGYPSAVRRCREG
jgi:hypothetical protein